MTMPKLDEKPVIDVLNRLLEAELAGVVRYTHYSFLVFGFGRIPIVHWLRAQAEESLTHAQSLGEWITTLGADPSLAIGPLLDTHQHDIATMLRESLDTERAALELYKQLLHLVEGIRPPDDLRRGDARRGRRQDAAQAGRDRIVFRAARRQARRERLILHNVRNYWRAAVAARSISVLG
jgi:bacterioferritin